MGCTFHLSGHCQTLFLGDGASAPTPVACEISAATRRHQHRTLGVLTAAVPVWGGGIVRVSLLSVQFSPRATRLGSVPGTSVYTSHCA